MSDFIDVNLTALLNQGVPHELAYQAVEILDAQSRGELPCPLEGEELEIVQQAWTIAMEFEQ